MVGVSVFERLLQSGVEKRLWTRSYTPNGNVGNEPRMRFHQLHRVFELLGITLYIRNFMWKAARIEHDKLPFADRDGVRGDINFVAFAFRRLLRSE